MKFMNRNQHSVKFDKENAALIYEIVMTAQQDGWKLSTYPSESGIRFDEENGGGIIVDFCKISEKEEVFDAEMYKVSAVFTKVLNDKNKESATKREVHMRQMEERKAKGCKAPWNSDCHLTCCSPESFNDYVH